RRTRLFFPVRDSLGVGDDFYLVLLEIRKRHPPAEALLVKLAQRRLIRVIVRRPEQHARGPAARDIREISPTRFPLHGILAAAFLAHRAKGAALDGCAIKRDRSVAALAKRDRRIERSHTNAVP